MQKRPATQTVNDREAPVRIGIAPRRGFEPHHDVACVMEDHGRGERPYPHRKFWCRTHGQWAYETAALMTFRFDDGEEVSR